MIVCFAVQLSMYSISLFSLFQVFLLLEPALLYYHVSFDLSTPFFIFFDVVFVCNTICGDSVSRIPHRKTLSGITHCLPIMFSERRRRDLNPRAAVNDLLPFQGSPFGQLGYFSNWQIFNGEGGIRTHAPLRTNGFQDRLVMTTSIPLHIFCCCRF